MGVFDNLDMVQTSEKTPYFEKGLYIAKIKKVKFFESQQGDETFVIEAEVLAYRGDHPLAPKPGQVASHVWKVGTGYKKMYALADWKAFLQGAFGKEAIEKLDGPSLKELSAKVIDKNALAGTKMLMDCWVKKNKDDDTAPGWTQHNWKRKATEADLAEFELAG
jgi:hypothetical protein